jgi:AraC-like DNA-binding protein
MPSVVALANDVQFVYGKITQFSQVQSCMLLWCKAGAGEVVLNGTRYPVMPEAFFVLPWNHAISYYPDARAPFFLAGVHLIPDHRSDTPVVFSVAHTLDDPLVDHPARRDSQPPLCTRVLCGTFTLARPLHFLADYIVACFQRGTPAEAQAYSFGTLLAEELIRVRPHLRHDAVIYEDVQQVMAYLQEHLSEKHRLDVLAEMAQCSSSTLIRLFRRQYKRTPFQYLLELRMEQAAHLLAATQTPVGEVGAQVGIDDPYYFSKVFKQYHRCTPSDYRASMALIGR